jgi:hypothetical protein
MIYDDCIKNVLTFHKHKVSKIRTKRPPKRPPSTERAYIHHASGFSLTIHVIKLGIAIVVACNISTYGSNFR